MKQISIIAGLAMILAGCASTAQQQPVAIDTFCLAAKKRTWSIQDTPETIRDAEAWNRLIDMRCGIPGKSAT